MSYTNKDELQEQVRKSQEEISTLKKEKTGWMVSTIIFLVLFVITLGMLFAR